METKLRIRDPADLPMVLTPTDISAVMSLSRNRTYQLIHSSGFPAFKVGKKLYRVRKDKFLEWLDKKMDFIEKEIA